MQTHSFVLFVLSRFNYNISAMFLLFYFVDDLVSQKNGETQNFCILQILFAYDIMSSDKEKLLFHSEHKTKPPMLPHRGFLFLF